MSFNFILGTFSLPEAMWFHEVHRRKYLIFHRSAILSWSLRNRLDRRNGIDEYSQYNQIEEALSICWVESMYEVNYYETESPVSLFVLWLYMFTKMWPYDANLIPVVGFKCHRCGRYRNATSVITRGIRAERCDNRLNHAITRAYAKVSFSIRWCGSKFVSDPRKCVTRDISTEANTVDITDWPDLACVESTMRRHRG